jgi:hypothetical protein
MLILADTLGNIFFAGTLLGIVGWGLVALHVWDSITLPKRNK